MGCEEIFPLLCKQLVSRFLVAAIGGIIIYSISRFTTKRTLSNAILLSAVTAGTHVMLYNLVDGSGLLIFRFEMGIVWPFVSILIIFSYFFLGFGIGSVIASAIGIPTAYLADRISFWRNSRKEEEGQ